MTTPSPPADAPAPARRANGDLALAAAIFGTVLIGLLGLLVASIWLFAGVEAMWRGGGPVRLARFCGFLALVTAYTVASIVVVQRGAARDFPALRGSTDTTPERWREWADRFADRRAGWRAAVAGAVLGLAISQMGARSAATAGEARSTGLAIWAVLLNVVLFANLAALARWTVLEIRALAAIGRRVRVSLLDRTALAPFVRTGLRNAVLWLVGSSLATTLMIDVDRPWLVLAVIAATMGIGIGALLLPNVGLNERLRAEKAGELAWVRAEIARARAALERDGAAERDAAAKLPALLAWEMRVERASTWPFDAPTLLRFSLLLLVPLGSWLCGALVERALGAVLG